MTRILSILSALVLSCTALIAAPKPDEVHVSNLAEFLHALKSNRIIWVDSDIDFGDQLAQFHSFDPQRLPEISYYDVLENHSQYTDRCFVDDNFDGYALYLTGFHNLTIKGGMYNGQRSLLRVKPRYAYVLSFIGCEDITIQGMVMGHTDEGYCQGGVLEFVDCRNVSVSDCDLYGCGIEGICFRRSNTLRMDNTSIRDCSYQIMTISESTDCTFQDCYFFRNREFTLFDLISSSNLQFIRCMISHNEGTLFNVQECENIVYQQCSMMHDMTKIGDYGPAVFKDCHWSNEYGVKRRSE